MTTTVTPSSPPPATARSLAARPRTSSDTSAAHQPVPLLTTTTATRTPAPGPPPDYDSIRDPSASAAAQAARNREKQAVRDQQRAQEEQLAAVHRGEVPAVQGPRSVEPASSASQSDPSSPRPRADSETWRQSVGTSVVSLGSAQQQPVGELVLDTRSILPPGMDVRDALAKCEDPTLGWSLQFWVTIADPLTQHVFFACPANGQCSWDPPVGAFVVPRSPDGEWWELADTTRKNRSYYYNTMTGKTQWTRPGGDAFVIPLGLIQQNALPARPEPSASTSQNPSTPRTPHRNNRRMSNLPPGSASPPTNSPLRASIIAPGPVAMPPHPEPLASSSRQSSSGTNLQSPTIGSALGGVPIAMHWPQAHPTGSPPKPHRQSSAPSPLGNGGVFAPPNGSGSYLSRAPLAAVDEGSGNETDRSDGSGWWGRRKSTAVGMMAAPLKGMKKPSRANITRSDSDETQPSENNHSHPPIVSRSTQDVSAPSPAMTTPASQVPESTEPIYVESPVNLKRLSTGWHPVLKPDISTAIQEFQTNDFAHKYFATKRSGVLRSKVPLERIMEWQRAPITSPLLVLSRQRQKDALTTFKVIQHVMCERDKPVEGLKSTPSSSSSMNLASLALGKKNGDTSPPPNGSGGASDKNVVLEEIKWMVALAVINGEMRDEVYSQLSKQLTKNPDPDSCVLGFQLFCVIVNAFGPSKNFEMFVRGFLKQHVGQETNGIGIMAKYCLNKLDVLASQGGRGKALTIGEIEHASDAAFYPSVYGESLDRIMELQARSYPNSKVPVILPFLADGILSLGGAQCEGTFRIPGDGDSVAELKARMDRGHYQLQGIDDPHVAASLFKLWLRELEEPVVPSRLYNDALAASKSPQETVQFIHRLPTNHKRVLLFVVSFGQVFLRPEVVEQTKMTASNLALVLAPNILRTTSQVLFTVFTNSSFESRFVHHLLTHLDCSVVDPEYRGYVPTQPLGA